MLMTKHSRPTTSAGEHKKARGQGMAVSRHVLKWPFATAYCMAPECVHYLVGRELQPLSMAEDLQRSRHRIVVVQGLSHALRQNR